MTVSLVREVGRTSIDAGTGFVGLRVSKKQKKISAAMSAIRQLNMHKAKKVIPKGVDKNIALVALRR